MNHAISAYENLPVVVGSCEDCRQCEQMRDALELICQMTMSLPDHKQELAGSLMANINSVARRGLAEKP